MNAVRKKQEKCPMMTNLGFQNHSEDYKGRKVENTGETDDIRYKRLQKLFDKKLKEEKIKFKKKMIDDVKESKSSQWYSKLKRITNFDQTKTEVTEVNEINHLTDQEQAEAIADSFSAISQEYEPVKREEIQIPPFSPSDVPQFQPHQIRKYLERLKTNKSTAPGDIPAKIIKEFSLFLCIPVADIINSGFRVGSWPKIYKSETITPTPKQFPPEDREMLRPIANLFNLDKIMETVVSEIIVSDMESDLDPSQYGNQKTTEPGLN